jgi:hypothetical protein
MPAAPDEGGRVGCPDHRPAMLTVVSLPQTCPDVKPAGYLMTSAVKGQT